ncbi:MAG: hypothetical protein HYS09_08460 [Chloroflexi bacterium]|nr:hypothetical protein [Chloroflexota bacterium]
MVMPAPGSGPIPVPDDFPVSWDGPEEQQLLWFWDQMHHPHPVTPATVSVDGIAFPAGFGRACETMYMPIQTMKVRSFNYYWYFGSVPATATPEEAAERDARLEAEMMQRAPGVLKVWEEVYLPEVQRHNQRLREFPYRDASLRELAAFLDEAKAIRERQWELHFLAVFPVMGAAMQFLQLYEQAFNQPENNEHYRMLQGFPNKSVEAGQALYDLAQEAKAVPAVGQVIRETPAEKLLAELARTAAGKEFRRKLDAYLDEYGWRSDAFEFMDPSWREDPTPVLHNLKGYLVEEALDPREEQARAAAEREILVKVMLESVAGDQAQHNQLQMLVSIAQQYLPIQENHNFYIDQMNTVLMRLPLLELGRRLAQSGAIQNVDDVFFLTAREIQDATVRADGRWRDTVARRRAERERWRGVVPPIFLGMAPPMEIPRGEMLERFFGLGLEPSRDPKVISGYGASRGVVTAPAKVVRTLNESDKLEPGDVLVCDMTMPAWTPLFSIVSAVVADSGGVLSHCAIVAREYRIPCVVGTRIGTQRIRDGQRLTVDGGKGIVRIEG